MSISTALANALSGLSANSRMAEVVSSNLANSLTEGYGRRQVELSAQSIGGKGAGVTVVAVHRMVDRGLLSDRRLADSSLAGYQRNADALDRLQMVLGQVGEDGSLASRLAALEEAMITSASDPSSEVRHGVVIDRLNDVTYAFAGAHDELQRLRQSADASIAADVETLNTALQRVERLNGDIQIASNTGVDPSALMDQRQQAIDSIAAIVPVRELERPYGKVALMTPNGQLLIDGPAVEVGFVPTATITADMTLAGGALSGLTINGKPVIGGPGAGRLDGGALGAAFALRDKTLVEAQTQLDLVARDLLERLQGPAADPTQAATDPGLLTDGGGAFNPLDTVGLAGRLRVNALVDPAQGGESRRLRDGVYSATAGPTGDSTQLERWISALSESRVLAGGGSSSGAAGHAARLVSQVSGSVVAIEDDLSYANARWSALREAELSNGVDSDQELQMLMRIEQAYAANARVIETIDLLMRKLMEL